MILAIAAGVAIIALVGFDVGRTTLSPAARAPLIERWSRVVWTVASRAPRPVRRGAMAAAGPLSIVVTFATWLGALWVAFALIYLPMLDRFVGLEGQSLRPYTFSEALYASGTALTTLGFGDVVASGVTPRFLTILEAASGLAVFTAAISYLPAIYTAVTDLRSAARVVGDLHAGHADHAAAVVVHGGLAAVESVRSEVVATREHLARFPVLHYFHPPPEESRLAFVSSAAGVCVTLRWGVDPTKVLHAEPWGEALETSLWRLLEDTARHVPTSTPDPALDRQAVLAAREAVARIDPALAAGGPVPDEAVRFLTLVDEVLEGYAGMHQHERPPLLPAPSRRSERTDR